MKTVINNFLIVLTALFIVGACTSHSPAPENQASQKPPQRDVAVSFKNGFCWKGYSQREQNSNLEECQKQAQQGKTCETSMYKHGGAAFDVCLRVPTSAPTKVIFCLKGSNQAEQNKNLAACQKSITAEQICETSLYRHGNAAYDVCVME